MSRKKQEKHTCRIERKKIIIMTSANAGLGKGKSSSCKACGSTTHFRSSSAACPQYKPKKKL